MEDRIDWLALQIFQRRSVEADPPKPRNSTQHPDHVVEGSSDPGKILRHSKMLPPRHAGQDQLTRFKQAERNGSQSWSKLPKSPRNLRMVRKGGGGRCKGPLKPELFSFPRA